MKTRFSAEFPARRWLFSKGPLSPLVGDDAFKALRCRVCRATGPSSAFASHKDRPYLRQGDAEKGAEKEDGEAFSPVGLVQTVESTPANYGRWSRQDGRQVNYAATLLCFSTVIERDGFLRDCFMRRNALECPDSAKKRRARAHTHTQSLRQVNSVSRIFRRYRSILESAPHVFFATEIFKDVNVSVVPLLPVTLVYAVHGNCQLAAFLPVRLSLTRKTLLEYRVCSDVRKSGKDVKVGLNVCIFE